MIATLKWKESEAKGAEFSLVDDLLIELRGISRQTTREHGIAAVLEKPSKQMMTVIMAGPHWGLDWFPEDYRGLDSHHTVADTFDPDTDDLLQKPKVATFYIFGHHSEFPLAYTISEEDALRGIREFFATSVRPSSLKWQLD